jgi:hypothetical protein
MRFLLVRRPVADKGAAAAIWDDVEILKSLLGVGDDG